MTIKRYKNPGEFMGAFRERFQGDRDRELVILMQRFAARVCEAVRGAVVKGGLGLEMRLDTPRTTKDADMIIAGSHDLDARLRYAGAVDLEDFLRFSVTPEKKAEILAPGMPYPGKRYRVQVRFGTGPGPWPGQPYRSFAAEISVREPAGFDVVESALEGFPQATVAPIRVYSLHWQLAEKLHAYTDPRHVTATRPELMRPRDLLDVCRCAVARTPGAVLESESLRQALERTFDGRKAAAAAEGVQLQDLPRSLPRMPEAWEKAFVESVKQGALPWSSPAEAHALAARFLEPVLQNSAKGRWDPALQRWVAPAPPGDGPPIEA